MRLIIEELETLGLTPEQIVGVLRIEQRALEIQRTYERERKRNYRANVPGTSPGRPRDTRARALSHKKERFSPKKERKKDKKEEVLESKKDIEGKYENPSNLKYENPWKPSEDHYRIGLEDRGLTRVQVDAEAAQYRDWLANTKHPHKDLNAGFRNCLRGEWFKQAKGTEPTRTNGHRDPTALKLEQQLIDDYRNGVKRGAIAQGELRQTPPWHNPKLGNARPNQPQKLQSKG